jgi:DNA-binding winged helix-turn-helix (wHTH) protein
MDRPRRLCFGEVSVDLEGHSVSRQGLETHLQEEYWNALRHMIERHPNWVTKEELFKVLGVSSDGSLTKQIQRIREALGDSHRPFRFIQNERGRGYKWPPKLDHQPAAKLYIHPNGYFEHQGPVWKEHRND